MKHFDIGRGILLGWLYQGQMASRMASIRLFICTLVLCGYFRSPSLQAAEVTAPPPLPLLTNVDQVLNLSPSEAARSFPTHLQGVITYYDPMGQLCFVQDQSAGIYLYLASATGEITVGDIVVVDGTSGAGQYSPIVNRAKMTRVGRGKLPEPKRTDIPALANGKEDSQWVEVEGIIHTQTETKGQLFFDLVWAGNPLSFGVRDYPKKDFPNLVDARVRVRGVVATQQNKKHQIAGAYLLVPTLEQIQIIEAPQPEPFSSPIRQVKNVMSYSRQGASDHLVRVRGVVTLQTLGKILFLKDDSGGIQVQTHEQMRVHPGDLIDVVGFPARGDYSPVLQHSMFKLISAGNAPLPKRVTVNQATSGEYDNELIQLEGEVLAEDETPENQVLVLNANKRVVRAIWNAREGGFAGALPTGSRVRLTGICKIHPDERGQPVDFSLWLRSPSDVRVLQRPSWWRVTRLIWFLSILSLAVAAGLAWVHTLNHRVQQQTKVIQNRERALEDRYSELFQNANDIIYTHDLSGRITSLNKTGERILGYSEMEAKTKRITELLNPQQSPFAQQMLNNSAASIPLTHREVEVVSKDGKILCLDVTSRPFYEHEKLLGIQGIARDITERKKAEEALRDSEQQLRKSLEERERIARDLHDGIIQSIYAIGLNLEDCRRYAGEENPDLDNRLQHLLDELNAVIRQVRNFIVGLESEDLKGPEFKTALKSLILTLGDTHSARFALNIDSSAADSLKAGQATQLLHIAREAMSNALRHSEAVRTTLSLQRYSGRLRFEISDDGVGFNTEATADHGYGLRNMAARAEDIGAAFKIISQVGEGTRIVLDIPTKNQHQSA